MNRTCVILILLFAAVAHSHAAPAQRIYWSDSSTQKIQSANLDGSDVQDVASSFVYSLAADPIAGKLYWAAAQSIGRSNFDGTAVETLVPSAFSGTATLVIDGSAGKMYWTNAGGDNIRRANLDGSNVQHVLSSGDFPKGLALDPAAGKMYWTESATSDRICRANLDGTGVQTLISTSLSQPGGIALDLTAGKMYFTDELLETISRANLDGTGRETLLSSSMVDFPAGIALDLDGGKMYWTESGFSSGLVRRAHLDGTSIEDLYQAVNPVPIILATVPEPSGLLLLIPSLGVIISRNRRR